MELEKNIEVFDSVMKQSKNMEGAMGAIAFAVLEMFRRSGMSETEINELHEKMKTHFMKPSNEECNAICRMVEARLEMDKEQAENTWYV